MGYPHFQHTYIHKSESVRSEMGTAESSKPRSSPHCPVQAAAGPFVGCILVILPASQNSIMQMGITLMSILEGQLIQLSF